MKKLVSLVLAVALVLSLCTVMSFAEDAERFTFEGFGGIGIYWLRSNEVPTAAIEFNAGAPFTAAGTSIFWASNPPSGNGEAWSTILLELYKFDTDYETTIAGKPVAAGSLENTKGDSYGQAGFSLEGTNCTICDYGPSKQGIQLVFNEVQPAGKYVFVFTEVGETGSYSVLGCKDDGDNYGSEYTKYYYGGVEQEKAFGFFAKFQNGGNFAKLSGSTEGVALHGASFDTIYVNDVMNFGEADGAASAKLDARDRKVDGSDGSVKTIRVRGWIGFESEIAEFGYKINKDAPVFGDFKVNTEDLVKDPGNGGAYASRFDITIPVEGLMGENTIVAVVKLADGTVVDIDENVKANGAGTGPNTKLTFLGLPIPDPTEIELDAEAEMFGYTGGANHGPNPLNIRDHISVAVKFTVPAGKAATQFAAACSPNWSNTARTGSDVLATVYAWDTDYDKSVEGAKLAEQQIYGHKDNDDLIVDFRTELAAGDYVIVFEATGDKNVGFWDCDSATDAKFQAYIDGDASDYKPAAFLMLVSDEVPATDLHGASFDTIYVNDVMNFGEGDGSASDKLDAKERKVDGSDGSVETIRFRGWIGFEQEIDQFGYKIGNSAPVFGDYKIATEDLVKDPANGGALASRFDITVPVADLKGTNTIVIVVKLADGTVVKIDENVSANGAGTAPNTQITFVGPQAPAPQTGDVSVMSIAAFAVIVLAAVLVIRKKVTE